jgi:hypothetical protein
MLGALILLVVAGGFLVALVHRKTLPSAGAQGFMTATLEPFDTDTIPSAVPIVSPGATLRVIWRPTDREPATHTGLICVTADGPGHVCVTYAAGERPADLLAQEIKRRGYRVANLD